MCHSSLSMTLSLSPSSCSLPASLRVRLDIYQIFPHFLPLLFTPTFKSATLFDQFCKCWPQYYRPASPLSLCLSTESHWKSKQSILHLWFNSFSVFVLKSPDAVVKSLQMHCLDCLVLLRLILSWPDLSALISFWSLHQAQQSIGVTAAPFSIDPDAYLNKYHKKRKKKKRELAGNQAWSLSFIRLEPKHCNSSLWVYQMFRARFFLHQPQWPPGVLPGSQLWISALPETPHDYFNRSCLSHSSN